MTRRDSKGSSPGELKILEALQYGERENPIYKSFTELRDETRLSNPVLSDYLKRLQKLGRIKRDIDSRKYFIQVAGKGALERDWLHKTLNKICDELERATTTEEMLEAEPEQVKNELELFLADLYQSLDRYRRESEEFHNMRLGGMKPDRSKSFIDATINLDLVLRSYANFMIFLYEHRDSAWLEISNILKERYHFTKHDEILGALGEKHKETICVPRIIGQVRKVPTEESVTIHINRKTGKPEYYKIEDKKTGETRYFRLIPEKERHAS